MSANFAIVFFFTVILTVTADVVVFDVRDPPSPSSSSDIRQEPQFEHTSAHAGAMPLARLLASPDDSDGFPRLTQFDEEPQLHEKVMLAELKANPDHVQRREHELRDEYRRITQQRDHYLPKQEQQRDQAIKKPVKKLEIPPPPPKSHSQPQPARIRGVVSAPVVSNRYLGIGRRDPNEEVFPSDFLRERSAKLKRQEEYERIQLQNPSGRWYFFVPSSPITVESQ